jgi:hypothetical protein
VLEDAKSRQDIVIMKTRTLVLLVFALLTPSQMAWSADNAVTRFTGSESGRTPLFEMDGPWLLDWSTRNKTALPSNFEMRLYTDAGTEFVGTVAQLEGVGRGLKLFEETGSLQIELISENLVWELLIRPVDEAAAGRMRRASEGAATLEDAAVAAMRRVGEDSFSSWRPVDDHTLLLFAADETTGFRVTFADRCTGLADATALSFVTASGSKLDQYDSILLDDGTRCFFDRVMPSLFD